MKQLRLKPREERRLQKGHLWIFSNEIDTERTPLKAFVPGELAVVETSRGRPLGIAYVNPHALIAARLLVADPETPIDADFWYFRLQKALSLRERLFDKPDYRWVHGEGDLLPGLIVDRYGQVVVVQLNTAGVERFRTEILEAIGRLVRPRAVVFRNDTAARELEGLGQGIEVVGELPERVTIEENGCRFLVDPVSGQKTGWFYDQRPNRRFAAKLASGKRGLDLFCYTGGFAVQMARAGAREVVAVDSSAKALALAGENARLNGVAGRIRFVEAEVFEFLRQEGGEFDLIVLDPPAFIKKRRDLEIGEEGYRRLNRLAMRRLAPDGILISCSCSQLMAADRLEAVLYQAGRGQGRELRRIYRGGQGPDHPVHPAMPETDYLKAFAFLLR